MSEDLGQNSAEEGKDVQTWLKSFFRTVQRKLFQRRVFTISTFVLLLMTAVFLTLSIVFHLAYLWLVVIFVAVVFLAIFTCAYNLPANSYRDHCPVSGTPTNVADYQASNDQVFVVELAESDVPFWIPVVVDPPPTYDVTCNVSLPPSYSRATAKLKLDLHLTAETIEERGPSPSYESACPTWGLYGQPVGGEFHSGDHGASRNREDS